MKRSLFLSLGLLVMFSFAAVGSCAEQDLQVSNDNLSFGHEGTEKNLFLTNKNQNSDLFWSVKSNASWLKVEQTKGTIANPSRIPANTPYQFSNLWPKLPQPWYFVNTAGVGIDREGNIYVADVNTEKDGRILKFNKYSEFIFKIDNLALSYRVRFAFNTNNDFFAASGDSILQFTQEGKFIKKIKPIIAGVQQDNFADAIAIDPKNNIYTIGQLIKGSNNELNASNRVFKFDKDGNYLKSFGKEGTSNNLIDGQFYSPFGLTSNVVFGIVVDSKGYLYIADNHYHRIQKFDSEGNFIKMWAYNTTDPRWPVWDDQYGELFTIDSQDIIYISHEHSSGIGKFDSEGNSIKIDWKDMNKWWTGHFYLQDAAVDREGNIYLADESRRPGIIKFDAQGNELINWRSYKLGEPGYFVHSQSIASDKNKYVYVLEAIKLIGWIGNPSPYVNRIQNFDDKGNLVAVIDSENAIKTADIPGAFDKGAILLLDSQNNFFYVINKSGLGNSSIIKLNAQGQLLKVWKNDTFGVIQDAKVNNFGEIFLISDARGNKGKLQVLKLDNQGNIIQGWEKEPLNLTLTSFDALTIDNKDNLFILDSKSKKILKLDINGKINGLYNFFEPVDIQNDQIKFAVDELYNFYLLSLDKKKVYKLDTSGYYLTSNFANSEDWITGLQHPTDISIRANGEIYILDNKYNRVQVLSQAVQPVKITIDRAKLPDLHNEAVLEFYNDRDASQAPVRVTVSADTETPNYPPTTGSLTPNSGSFNAGQFLTFKAEYSDRNGANDLYYGLLVLDTGAKAIQLAYNLGTKRIALMDDNNNWIALYDVGAGGIIENKYLKLDCARSKAYQKPGDPKTLVVEYLLSFKDAANGPLKAYLVARDKALNQSSWDTKGNITVTAISAPVVTIASPEPYAMVSASGFTIQGTATPLLGIEEVAVYLYDYGRNGWSINNSKANYNSQTGDWNLAIAKEQFSAGQYANFWIRAKDKSGNYSPWKTLTVLVESLADTAPPTLSISSPGNNATVPVSGFSFSGIAYDQSGVAEVRVNVYNQGTLVVDNAAAAYNTQSNLWSFVVAQDKLTPGKSIRLQVKAKDTKGNWTPSWQEITVTVSSNSVVAPASLIRRYSTPLGKSNIFSRKK